MDISKQEKFGAIVSAIVIFSSLPSHAAPDEAWVALKKSGEVADVGADYVKASNYYAQALKQFTSTDASQRLDIEARLAADYVHQLKFSVAEPLVKHILVALPELKKTGKFDPEVLVSVKYLSEVYNQGFKGSLPIELRKKNFNLFEPVSLSLANLVAPNDDEMYARRYDRARQYIYFSEPNQAHKILGELWQEMPKTSPLYVNTQLAQAAVEWGMHQPQMMERLQRELSKKYDQGTLLTKIGRAHLYAANYDEADRVLEKAMAALAAKKPPDVKAEIEVHRLIMNSYDDRNMFAKSEPHARKIVELVEYSKGTKSDEYTKAVNKLVFYLNNLKKTDEAKKWKAKIPNNYDWLLDDEKASPTKTR